MLTSPEMQMWKEVLEGIAVPFAGTALGSACVLFMKKERPSDP